jgi:DNA primase large subunit
MKKIRVAKESDEPHLTFYNTLPISVVDFETFRKYVEHRIRILKQMEQSVPEARHFDMSTADMDVLSHFFCRVVCAQLPWAAAWFVNAEAVLFRHRVNRNLAESMKFWEKEVLPGMSNVEERATGELVIGRSSAYMPSSKRSHSHAGAIVHFTKVLDLVGRRAVKISRGHCSMNEECVKSVLVSEFRKHLRKRMSVLADVVQEEPDERMQRLCTDLLMAPAKQERTGDFSWRDSEKYFPPCIQQILHKLQMDGHLKYNERQTLCLFLKECGMSVDDNIALLRNSFKVSRETFNKEYLYSIRHNYGLEGKKANYNCFNCAKVSSLENGRKESICPFVGNESYVRELVKDRGVDIEEILSTGFYNKKCTRLLEALSKKEASRIVISPIRYYADYRKADSNEEKE